MSQPGMKSWKKKGLYIKDIKIRLGHRTATRYKMLGGRKGDSDEKARFKIHISCLESQRLHEPARIYTWKI